MATFNNFCLMVIFMAITTLLVKTVLSYDEDYDPYEDPVPPMTNYEKQLTDCIMKLYPPCDDLYLFGTMFFGNEKISKYCCTSIRQWGKQCHDALTKYNLELPKYKANRTQILQRSNQAWNECNQPYHARRQTLHFEIPTIIAKGYPTYE
ncbi:hypothetical protein VNO78_27827 [Psophocarpus tetragonolobus]|uniref:Prolamin-like domain-containing protein n=1 Tax=Psophocarpus tetragonolobus TaxID=3891 RepID=A0AAN9XB24_PSOTE